MGHGQLVLKTSSSGPWRVDCECGWKSAVATARETVIRTACGHLAAAEQAKATATALRSSPQPSNGARQRHRRKPLVIRNRPEPSRYVPDASSNSEARATQQGNRNLARPILGRGESDRGQSTGVPTD